MLSPSRTSNARLRARACDLSVITSGHDVADARLHRIVAAAVRAGLSVEVLAIGDARGGPANAAVRTWPRSGLLTRASRALTMPWRARGEVLLTLDPDAAVGAVAASVVRRRLRVVDVHEDYAALLQDRAWASGWRRRLAASLVRLAMIAGERADLTVVADEHLPPPSDRCRKRLVVRNLPDLSVVGIAGTTENAGSLRAVYVGDVRRSRGLETMIEAVAGAESWVLDIVGPVDRDDAAWLESRMLRADVAGRVRLHGRQPPESAWRIASGAAVGLALLEDTPAFRAALPTKVYEYLAAGMAVLATPLPRVERLLAEARAGEVVRNAAEAARFLRHWAGPGRADLEHLRAAARGWRRTLESSESPYDELAGELLTMCRNVGRVGESQR